MNDESKIFGITVRGVLAIIITTSCCAIAIFIKDIGVLKDLAFLVLGFYFGQKSIQQTPPGGPNAQVSSTSTVVTSVKPADDASKS